MESLLRSDLPVVQAIILILSLLYVLLTMLADILNAVLDPRLRGLLMSDVTIETARPSVWRKMRGNTGALIGAHFWQLSS